MDHFKLLFGFPQLLEHELLLEDGVRFHQVFSAVVELAGDDQEGADCFAGLCKVDTFISKQDPFDIEQLLLLLESIIELAQFEIDDGQLLLHFVNSAVMRPVLLFVQADCFLKEFDCFL